MTKTEKDNREQSSGSIVIEAGDGSSDDSFVPSPSPFTKDGSKQCKQEVNRHNSNGVDKRPNENIPIELLKEYETEKVPSATAVLDSKTPESRPVQNNKSSKSSDFASSLTNSKRSLAVASSELKSSAEQTYKKPRVVQTAGNTMEQNNTQTKQDKEALEQSDSKSDAQKRERLTTRSSQRESKDNSSTNQSSSNKNQNSTEDYQRSEVVTKYVDLPAISSGLLPLGHANEGKLKELENALQLNPNDPDDHWREDWSGNLAFVYKEVPNPTIPKQDRKKGAAALPFWEWALGTNTGPQCKTLLKVLFQHVYNMDGTPMMAKRLLADAVQNYQKNTTEMVKAVQRISYDPEVLQQDGWTTQKSKAPIGASGGPYHIGGRLIWQKFEAVIIAYVHDHDIGDLWKAMWLEEHETFDLEAEELQEGIRNYQRKTNQLQEKNRTTSVSSASSSAGPGSSRFAELSSYTVEGIEHGIVLASTYHPHARHGIVWPARVMHVSEYTTPQPQTKRSSSKNRIEVVFLAPYWNGRSTQSSGGRRVVEAYGDNPSQAKNMFSSGSLLELDTVEVSRESIQKYPYDGEELNISQLRDEFRFLGLPKPAFPRFLDSHRMALALKNFAKHEIKSDASLVDTRAMSTLTDKHIMSIQAALFPSVVLHLPFQFMLSQLPSPAQGSSMGADEADEEMEPVLQLGTMLNAMKPPDCWGHTKPDMVNTLSPSKDSENSTPIRSILSPQQVAINSDDHADESAWSLDTIASEYLINALDKGGVSLLSHRLCDEITHLLSRLRKDLSEWRGLNSSERRGRLQVFLLSCLLAKSYGEEIIQSNKYPDKVLSEWRKSCERLYKKATLILSAPGFGNGVSLIITDSRCNEHLTASGCVERTVRLPAALKGARMAGAGASPNIQIINPVEDQYTDIAEKKILPKAHKSSYLRRMKAKCSALQPGSKGAKLTDDSDGQGGEDTMGSPGSYMAAVTGVAAAIKAVDQIVSGQCVNAFCATRPPGHHAGRDLHPMKAISNGFCLLNPAACAALYATMPQSEGGPGLKRVCVIDFDVHHGNGTQDILCSTHDSRFLYVSIHAGGPQVNGYDIESDDAFGDSSLRSLTPGSATRSGIFPGRCGDSSPHGGVLNIPLGPRVIAHDVGTALVTKVSPVVAAFSPDLIILSAGFDAHKNDPLGMGGLSAEDFGSITDVACSMAYRCCSGRVLSILEGGYGIPCCRPQNNLFLPPSSQSSHQNSKTSMDDADGENKYSPPSSLESTYVPPSQESISQKQRQQQQQQQQQGSSQLKIMDLGDDLPESMEDEVPSGLRKKLDRCHAEGFVECVKEHISSLARNNMRKS